MPCPTCIAIQALLNAGGLPDDLSRAVGHELGHRVERRVKRTVARKVSSYHKRLGRILKRLKDRHTLKSGKWKKGWNQSRLMKAAHKEAKRK